MITLRTARRLVLSCLLALGGLTFGQTAEARIVFFPQTSPAGETDRDAASGGMVIPGETGCPSAVTICPSAERFRAPSRV